MDTHICLDLPELAGLKWKEGERGGFGITYVSTDGTLLVKIQKVIWVEGKWSQRIEDGYYPISVWLHNSDFESPYTSTLDIETEARLTQIMGELNVSPPVVSYGFCPDRNYFYILMGKKGVSFKTICERERNTYMKRVNFVQVKEKLRRMVNEGWVHNDLHPGNYLLSDPPENEFYMIDFGSLKKYNPEIHGTKEEIISSLYESVCEGLGECEDEHKITCLDEGIKIKGGKRKTKKYKYRNSRNSRKSKKTKKQNQKGGKSKKSYIKRKRLRNKKKSTKRK